MAQLSADLGLGGKSRTANRSIEKIRKSVNKCIRTDIAKLESTFPEFTEHLRFIITGTSCKYDPPSDIEWKLSSKK